MDGAAPARPVRPRSLLRVDKVEVDLLSLLPRIPSLSRAVEPVNPNPNTTVSVLAVDPPLPELQAAIAESPPPGAAPRPPLRPSQAVQAGVQPFRRPRRNTVTSPSELLRRFRPPQTSPVLTVIAIGCVVSVRTPTTTFPSP